jgi:Ca2+-binding EF-hand superfamily protein
MYSTLKSRSLFVTSITALLSSALCHAQPGPPAGGPNGKPAPRKCPAEKVVIAGHDIAEILNMLGAELLEGATDKELSGYSQIFDHTDADKDGKHSQKEYIENGRHMNPQARQGIFGAADNNADGFVTRSEYLLNRVITDEAKAIIQPMDKDKDGKISRAEFIKGSPIKDKELSAAVFDALDTSGDGSIFIPEYLRVWGGWARPDYREQEKVIDDRLKTIRADLSTPVTKGTP